jgi:hypothetical protein
MKREASSVVTIALSFVLASAVISLALYLMLGQERVRRTLFFPDLLSDEVHAEARIVTRRATSRDAVQLLLEEVILGPASINSSRVVPKTTRIEAIFLDDRTVYLDLNPRAIGDSPDVRVDFADALELLERNVLFNFRSVQDVVITVDGQVPYTPYFDLERPKTQNLENET